MSTITAWVTSDGNGRSSTAVLIHCSFPGTRSVTGGITSGTATASSAASGVTGTRAQRTRDGSSAARTVRFHSSPLSTPATPATGTVHQPGVTQHNAPATVSTTKFSSDQPTREIDGSPRHQCSTTATRCRNGASRNIGSRDASSTQDSATTDAATEIAAHGATNAPTSTPSTTLRRSSHPNDGRRTSAGQASTTRPVVNRPRATSM